jgi:hypothetical protein
MRIKKKSVTRLASLSALGAGALGVAAGTAEASIIYTPLPPGTTVGFPAGGVSKTISLPGGAGFRVYRSSSASWSSSTWRVLAQGSSVAFKGLAGLLSIVGPGKKWNTAAGSVVASVNIASRGLRRTSTYVPPPDGGSGYWTTTITSWAKGNNFANKYALFRFPGSGGNLYGWLELSNVVSPNSGPLVTLEGYAYDDSGAYIPAGDTGGIPEPSTFVLTGLGALVLGAAGLRRWRAARKA